MKQYRGITLLNALISLSILLILISLSSDNLAYLQESNSSQQALNQITKTIQLARSFAVMNRSLVTVCRSVDGIECSGQWHDGVLVFSDQNGDRIINETDKLLYYAAQPKLNGTIKWRAFQNRQYLQITSQGFTRYQNGNFTYCPHNADPRKALQLVINRTGRTRFARDNDGDGIVEDSQGKPVTCR